MNNIQEILAQNLGELKCSPQRINQISKQTLQDLSKAHNTHNKLLPSQTICELLASIKELQPFKDNHDTIQFTFKLNLVRLIINANFSQLPDNKIYGLMCMIFAKSLTNFNQKLQNQEKSYVVMKETSKCLVINQIMLRLIQRSRLFFPQYFRTLLNMVSKIRHSFQRNMKSLRKTTIQINKEQMMGQVLTLAYSKQTDKTQIVACMALLFQFTISQASNFYQASFNRKQLLKLQTTKQIITEINSIYQKFTPSLKSQIQIPNQFKNYEQMANAQVQNEPIYLEEPIQFKQLTPRIYDEEQSVILKKLRHKKSKMEKKMHLTLRRSTQQKLQEKQVFDKVKHDRIHRQQKKQMFVMQKQTEEAKKFHRMTKKVKSIKKQGKLGRKGKTGKPGKPSKGK